MRWPRIIFFLTAGKKPDKIGLSEFPAPCKSNVSPGSCGYVHSADTGLYYLQSRYYNPKIGRFLNADAFASTGQGMLGNNMFAYCNNNPTSYSDSAGTFRQDFTVNTEIILDPEGNRPQTLADYIARQNRYSGVMEKEKRWGRIYQATMDSAAESTLGSIDEAMFAGTVSLVFLGGVPSAITVLGAVAMGFLYGSARGFVNALKQEGIL